MKGEGEKREVGSREREGKSFSFRSKIRIECRVDNPAQWTGGRLMGVVRTFQYL